MGDSSSGAKRRCYHSCFGDLFFGGARISGIVSMNVDAIRTLSSKRHRHGYEFLILYGNDTIRNRGLVESPKSFHRFGREFVQLLDFIQVIFVIH